MDFDIHEAAGEGRFGEIKGYLAAGGNPNVVDDNGATPLFLAALADHPDVCEILLECGADVNRPINDGRTPLFIAVQQQLLHICDILISHGADVNAGTTKGITPLACAARSGNRDICKLLLESGADVDIATSQGRADVCQLLLEYGASITARMRNEDTPLRIAAQKGHVHVHRLLQKFAELPPLHRAAYFNNTETLRTLLDAGADPFARSLKGRLAVEVAREEGAAEAVALLEAAMKDWELVRERNAALLLQPDSDVKGAGRRPAKPKKKRPPPILPAQDAAQLAVKTPPESLAMVRATAAALPGIVLSDTSAVTSPVSDGPRMFISDSASPGDGPSAPVSQEETASEDAEGRRGVAPAQVALSLPSAPAEASVSGAAAAAAAASAGSATPRPATAPLPVQPLTPGLKEVVLGRISFYEDRELGTNHHTPVFYGTDLSVGRPCAVKMVWKRDARLAYREIEQLRTLSHPNILQLYGKEEDDRFCYLALELCKCTISRLIPERDTDGVVDRPSWSLGGAPHPSLTVEYRYALCRQLLEGLAYLHEHNIVHRDLQPSNVLIARNDVLKIADFGLSKQLDRASFSTQVGSAYCTPPEVELNLRMTPAVDVFNAGCLIYHILSDGYFPFGSRTERRMHILRRAKPDLDHELFVPPGRETEARMLVEWMVEYNADSRPTVAQALQHPFFWTLANQMRLFERVKEFIDTRATNKAAQDAARSLDVRGLHVLGRNWGASGRFHPDLVRRAYEHGNKCVSVCDMVRFVRNSIQHYAEVGPDARARHGQTPAQFFESVKRLFPDLFMHVYNRILPFVRQRDVQLADVLDIALLQ